MSFNDLHKTIEDSNRVQLYEISRSGFIVRYTSAEQNIIVGGQTYAAFPGLSSTEVNNTGEDQRNQVTIELTTDEEIAQDLIRFIPSVEITLAIFSLERDDPEQQLIHEWSGIYVSYEANYPRMRLTFSPFDRELARDALSASFGVNCQWTQYDNNCGLSPLSFQESGNITAVNGTVIETDLNLISTSDEHFVAGFIQVGGEFGPERAWIIGQEGTNSIEVDRISPSMTVGSSIDVLPSCRGDFNRCNTIFNNRQRFMGAPYANKLNMFASDVRGNF